MKKPLLLIALFASFAFSAYSQTLIGNQQVIELPTTKSGNYTQALLYLPDDYDASKKYPLIIYLHGSGEAGTDIHKLLETGLPQRIAQGFKPEAVNPITGVKRKFIVVSPQAPQWSYQYMHIKYMLPEIIRKYKVDIQRIYITGISAGGYGVWTCITDDTSFCKTIAAIAPMSAAPVESYRVSKLPNAKKYDVPVWNICGESDSFWGTAEQYTNIIDNPDSVTIAKLTGLPNVGHWAWDYGYDPAWKKKGMNVYEWMLQFKRSKPETDTDVIVADESKKKGCKGKKINIDKGSDNGRYINGNSFNYSPGDFFVLKANGPYSYLSLENVHGTPTCPVTIINDGGQVKMTNGIALINCTYVRVDGRGSKKDKYGFYISDPSNGGVAVDIFGHSKGIEVNNINVNNKTYGFWVKEEAQCDKNYDYPSWTIDSIFIHDNLIENTGQEGMYMGSTSPNGERQIFCNGQWISPIPMRLGDIYVYDNIVNNTKRAGIQLSGASVGINRIYNNKVSNSGGDGGLAQGAGIQLGGCSHAFIYNNIINNTYLPGIYSLGSGFIRIRNNTISNSGRLNGQVIADMQGIAVDTRITQPTQELTTFHIRNNKIMNCTSSADIAINQSYPTYSLTNNIICGNTRNNGGTAAILKIAIGVHWSGCSEEKTISSDSSQPKISAIVDDNNNLNKTNSYIYPNPAADVINILLSEGLSGKLLLNIYDAQQRLVQTSTIYKNTPTMLQTLNIKTLTPGFYFIQIINTQQKLVLKFIKENK